MKEINEKEIEAAVGGGDTVDRSLVHETDDSCEQFEALPQYSFLVGSRMCSICKHGKPSASVGIAVGRIYCTLGVSK